MKGSEKMARRKLPSYQKKVTLTLTVKPEIKEMLIAVSDAKEKSISVLLEEYAAKEYVKLTKEQKVAVNIPGQMSLSDMESNNCNNNDNNTCENKSNTKRKSKNINNETVEA